MATLIIKTQKTFHLRQELQLVWNRREFSLLAILLFSPSPPVYHQCLLSSHSQPALCSVLRAESGAGDRRWGKGAWELVPGLTAQHFGAGLVEKSRFCSPATAHRCQTAAERGASPQILILTGLIVEMSCTSAQNERRAFSF